MTKEELGERGKFLNSIIISDETEAVDYSVVAMLAENSTTENPCIIVISSTEDKKDIYNVNINMIDSQNATQLEVFALLSYADYQGMTVSGIQGSYINIKSCMEHANQKGYCGNTLGYKIFVTKRFKWVSILEKMMTDYMQSGVYRQYQFCESVLSCFEELCINAEGKETSATSIITMENGNKSNQGETDDKSEVSYEKNVANEMHLNPVTEKLREKILGKMFELSADEIKDMANENINSEGLNNTDDTVSKTDKSTDKVFKDGKSEENREENESKKSAKVKEEDIKANFSENIVKNEDTGIAENVTTENSEIIKESTTTEVSESIMNNLPVKNSFNEDKTLKTQKATEFNPAKNNNVRQAGNAFIDKEADNKEEKTLIDSDWDKFYLADYTICSRPSTKKNRKDVHYVVWYIEEGIFCKRFGEKRWYEWVLLFTDREQYQKVIEFVRNLPMGEDLKFTADKNYWKDFLGKKL